MEQKNEQTPQMQPQNYGRQFWRMWGPLVIKMGIAFAVSIIASTVFCAVYIMKQYGVTTEMLKNSQQMGALYDTILKQATTLSGEMSEEFLKYTTYVEGLAALLTIPVLGVMFHRDRRSERMNGVVPNRKAPIWKYIAVVMMSAAMCLGLNNLIIIGNFSAVSETYEKTMEALYAAPFAVQIASLGILVPMCEEMVFRGLMFKRIRERSSYLQAAIYSSLIFALLHMNLVQMIYGFVMGMAFTYIYEKYGSVKAPVLAHMAANILSVAATEMKLFDWMMKDIMRMGVITVVCAAIASTMYVFMQRIEEKPDITGMSGEEENLAEI